MPMTPAPFRRAILLFLAAGLLTLGLAAPVRAQSCTFSASNIVLGPVDVLGSSPTTATGNIAVNCSTFLGLLTSITVTIELGDGSAGLFGSLRRLGGPSGSSLAYDLYQNPTHTTIFGGSQGTHGGQPVVLTGSSVLSLLTTTGMNVPVYARVPGAQNAAVPGAYSATFSRQPLDVRATTETCRPVLGCDTRVTGFTFAVQAQVRPNCRVVADDLDFGQHGLLDRPVDATSQVRVTCTAGTSYTLGLGHGLQAAGIGGRQMRDLAGHRVGYQLYRDAARTQPWGLIADGLATTDAGTGVSRAVTVHGRVPPQPTPPPGAYSDTVVVTVTY
mgnify:FL=1